MSAPRLCGLVLAAGAGRRFGGPKVLARTPEWEPWVVRAVRMLRASGCGDVLVTVGAAMAEAAAIVPSDATVVTVPDWPDGLSASLRAGLQAAGALPADAMIVTPVDTPEAPSSAVERLVGVAGAPLDEALVQAVYRGTPGHPVLLGRHHWAPLAASVSGDRGARPYLAAHGVREVECGDLWPGADIDVSPASPVE